MEGQSNNSCYVEVPPIAAIYIKMQAIVSHIPGYYINLKSSPLLPSLFSLSPPHLLLFILHTPILSDSLFSSPFFLFLPLFLLLSSLSHLYLFTNTHMPVFKPVFLFVHVIVYTCCSLQWSVNVWTLCQILGMLK